MSGYADAAQIRRWQEAVAADPGDPAFLPLAETYRREGRLEVARRLCLRGLEQQPEHVDAHALLGRVYRETGELDQAYDEWDIALRLDPEHRLARRSIAYLCLERREWAGAVRHLEAALAREPRDERVASALALARQHLESAPAAPPADPGARLAGPLDRFVRESRVRLALLIEPSGRVLAQHGFSRELDVAAFASLGAGVHMASGALAELLGQRRFEQLYQGRGEHQLFLGSVTTPAGELILTAVFGATSNIGLVRVRFSAFADEVATLAWRPRGAARPDAAAFEAELAAGLGGAAEGERPSILRP